MSVCILGSVNRDVVARVPRLPRPGETVAAGDVAYLQGGKGANQAVAAARMGARVRMAGAVGADDAGATLLAELAAAGVDVAAVERLPDVLTGTAFITAAADGENQIVFVAGANARVTADRLDPAFADDAVLLVQLETPVAATAALFGRGQPRCRILNTAPALPEAAALFEATDLLVLNQTELAAYLHLADAPRDAAGTAQARQLLVREGQAAIVTLGAAGAVLVGRDELVHAPAVAVPVVDTTGAGDCFCGALAALLAEGHSPRDALGIANAAAALAVGRAGAGPAMPTRSEVEALLAATEHAPPIKTPAPPDLGRAREPAGDRQE